ncbi:hypothetical protein APR41_08310 [Salegentibacter salinarum]|uniref:Co-chaperone DjlA N-terminal domain-containing protein n=1 Tax=Salegentibacter salinarum TaxID=447422 RepID=A0A2N0TQ12_9FLAO|nr:hypothetical protein [Salegentibacter salinarum]PKD16796.1 hypothetical protein APR41_08310 [Salegentibacter salinarum]SKB58856.1 hypothetical protein SAMN05660903_01530 [Salegentibacter salinarum]
MELSKKHVFTEEFYQNIGMLFYAIAASDKVVRTEEIKTLNDLVQKKWVPIDNQIDEFGTDEAYKIEMIFDWLEEKAPEAEWAFNEFRQYKKDNEELFTSPINQLIWETADAIAASFAGKNKSEVIMLSKLKMLLSK